MQVASLSVGIGFAGMPGFMSDMNRLNVTINATANMMTRAGAQAGAGFASNFRNGFLPMLSLFDEAVQGSQMLGRALSAITGVGVAAEFSGLSVGFESLLGSAAAARTMLGDLRSMGSRTMFDTGQLADYAKMLLATGVAGDRVLPVMRTLTDTASALNLDTGGVGRLAKAVTDIQGTARGVGGQEMLQLRNAGVNLAGVVNAAQGTNFRGVGEAQSYLRQFSGQQAADIILKGLDAKFGGMAEKIGMGTPLGIMQNIGESGKNLMLPTGGLLVAALMPLGKFVRGILDFAGQINELTGGAAGLISLAGLLRLGRNVFINAAEAAVMKIWDLTQSLRGLGAAAGAARLGMGAGAPHVVPLGAGGGAGGAGGAGGIANFFRYVRNPGLIMQALKGAGAGGVLKGIGGGLLGGAKALGSAGGFFLPLLADLGLNALGNHLGGKAGNVLKGIGTGIGIGGGLGGFFGPGGAAIGSVVGGIGGAIYGSMQKVDSPGGVKTAEEEHSRAMKEHADALKGHGRMIGGGSRGRMAVGFLESDLAMGYLLANGIA